MMTIAVAVVATIYCCNTITVNGIANRGENDWIFLNETDVNGIALHENSTTSFNTNNTHDIPPITSPAVANNTLRGNTASQSCNQKVYLTNELSKACRLSEYCCRNRVFEFQFKKEAEKCAHPNNTVTSCNSLLSCQNTCKSKAPTGYGCIDGTTIGKYSIVISDCYTNCFNNFYVCPTNTIPNSSSYSKRISIPEIICIAIIVGGLLICLVKTTLCKDCHMSPMRRESSSKVHVIASTSTKDDYTNVL